MFVLAAEFGNLTRAAEAAGTVQPVVSQRLKALEAALGRKLLERTPRFVRPTADGLAFLERARTLLVVHDAAIDFEKQPVTRLSLGVSDHALGVALADVLGRLRSALPARAAIEVRTGMSLDIRARFDAGEMDAAVIRREGAAGEGEVLGYDPLGWRAAEDWAFAAGAPVPLATIGPPCGVRAVALRTLDRAGMPWRETFVGGSCAALLAGMRAGLGVAPMGRLASGGAPDRGPALGLPPLPQSEIVLLARAGTPAIAEAVRALAAGIRASLR